MIRFGQFKYNKTMMGLIGAAFVGTALIALVAVNRTRGLVECMELPSSHLLTQRTTQTAARRRCQSSQDNNLAEQNAAERSHYSRRRCMSALLSL